MEWGQELGEAVEKEGEALETGELSTRNSRGNVSEEGWCPHTSVISACNVSSPIVHLEKSYLSNKIYLQWAEFQDDFKESHPSLIPYRRVLVGPVNRMECSFGD